MESRESAKLLLERNDINVNIPDNWNGRTALHWACYQRYPASVDLLLQRDDIDPNARDINGYAPLVIVCRVYGSNAVDNNGVSIFARCMNNQDSIDSDYADEIESLLRAAGAKAMESWKYCSH
ncbi:hypothetical protein V8E54_013440 [Elaphomyces granulatus]